ncbi:tumor necrosis factor receptor superfamily member 22-like isoform X1 [Labeo rohita]|uniref:Tumor necrosis factor receptor superfamily member 22-like isoform X1 n=1 Tax=Labeo rohita TaxID=84645 RepID=A0A498LS01_LABRO|nr:tumor necrosis factor receptor superfamily member 22-like isoform X1 [Labeo rohita]
MQSTPATRQYVTQKCTAKQSKTVCETCKDGYYMDDYNGSYNFCKHCTKCTKDRFCRSDKSNSGSSQCTEEEEVPMPVQEMCGTDEKLEDV